jgi:two-component system sensor histidine kinase KdpD
MVDLETTRPDPDSLLVLANQKNRGQLKIFFGACAGVGKTYAMLKEARRLRAQGLDVVVGVVETHARKETESMVKGLTLLPAKHIAHRGRRIQEFDLDAALARHPGLILIDELAHSNASGSRHPKRWQDVEELLDAGINVFTTVNVQHLESLNDVVGGITGIIVRETIPDHIFDHADEVVLVDLTPDDLQQRLKEGKVYIPGQAERAIEHFFRKGNLIALRELSLRRTADRVDEQMRAFRDSQFNERIWHSRDALLLCLGHQRGNEKLVRVTARLAARLGCVWHAIYVETPKLHRLSQDNRRGILSTLKLAQELGAETATMSEPDEHQAVLRYAREHSLGKIVIGRRKEKRWKLHCGFADQMAHLAPDLDLVVIGLDDAPPLAASKSTDTRTFNEKFSHQLQGCGVAIALCAFITLVSLWLVPVFDQANLVMVYLLGVAVIALFYGRWPSAFAAVINVASFDLSFVEPRGSLAVTDAQYLVTFAVMLTVGLLIGNLTAGVRYQARIARHREKRSLYLYQMSKSLNQAMTEEAIAQASQHFIASSLRAKASVLLPQTNGALKQITSPDREIIAVDEAIARWSFDKQTPAGAGTDTLPGVPYQLLPLLASGQTRGLLAVEPSNIRSLMVPEQQRLLQIFTVLIANALERLHLAASAESARLDAEREQLRNSLLSALSHDLRTPLTVLFGQAEILTLDLASENSPHAMQANQIRQQVLSTTRLVNNLLDMARIQSGGFNLRKEWQSLEEITGSTLRLQEITLSPHHIEVDIPADLPLIYCDASLIERVLSNLLENAHKYAGVNANIGIKAQQKDDWLAVEVWDSGPGIPAGTERQIFDKFSRGEQESAVPGVGLGLAICHAIIDVHGGRIWAENRPQGGARFCFLLPLEKQPDVEMEINEEM